MNNTENLEQRCLTPEKRFRTKERYKAFMGIVVRGDELD